MYKILKLNFLFLIWVLFLFNTVSVFGNKKIHSVKTKCLLLWTEYPNEKEWVMYVLNNCDSSYRLEKKILIVKTKNLQIKNKSILDTKGTIVGPNQKKLLFILSKEIKNKKSLLLWKLID